jgi:hypothetical protein
MPTARYRGPPMTLANMRANGGRSLAIRCDLCHHEAVINVDRFGEDVPVPTFRSRMVCTRCGIIGADARPNWREAAARDPNSGQPLRVKSTRILPLRELPSLKVRLPL